MHPCDILQKRTLKEQASTLMLEGIPFQEEEFEPCPVGACSGELSKYHERNIIQTIQDKYPNQLNDYPMGIDVVLVT